MEKNKLMTRKAAKLFLFIGRLVLGSVFCVSGYLKVIETFRFASDIVAYDVIPHDWVPLVAGILPWVEITIGIALLTGTLLGGSALMSSILMACFIFFQASALFRGLEVSCGCFGSSSLSDPVTSLTLLRTAGLMALSGRP